MENNNPLSVINLEALSTEELRSLQQRIPDIIEEREEVDRKAKFAEKLPLIAKFRKRRDQINEAYEGFDGFDFTEKVTLTFQIEANVLTTYDTIADDDTEIEFGESPDVSDLFDIDFDVSVVGKFENEDADLIAERVNDILADCDDGRRLLTPKLHAKFQKLLGEYAELAKELAANDIKFSDLDEGEEDESV